MEPSFQRAAGLWTPQKMSRLVESLLIRVPLPAFYFDGTDDNKWLVVDGLQRLSTLHRFIVEPDPSARLRLAGLEYLHDLDGHTYDTLPRSMRRRIDETQVTLHVIRPGTPPEVKYNIFRRINTGGLVLTPQEIRHALNPGPALELLDALAKSPEFVEATGGTVSAARMLDRELVLRFCAFTLRPPTVPENVYGNVDRFLTDTMEILNKSSPKVRDDLKIRFIRSMQAAKAVFGNDAFRKRHFVGAHRHPINKALFELWSFLLGQIPKESLHVLVEIRDEIQARHIRLMNEDGFFLAAISQGTGDPGKVRYRFRAILALISEALKAERGDA
ncbi:MAG: DUF262 domain-containing protein [Vicinamibacterales bacterium]